MPEQRTQGTPALQQALQEIDEFLCCRTPEEWLAQAPLRLPELLSDHANCEKKAASTALSLTYRYDLPSADLQALSKLAREELRHFEQVLDVMATLSIRMQPLSASGYAAGLRQLVSTREPERQVDTLLVCAIVEARSCERFARLAPRLDDPLQGFYQRLLASEARHYQVYLDMAQRQALEHALADDYCALQLARLLEQEAELVVTPAECLRFHSGPLADASATHCSATPADSVAGV